ncbi:dolichyl-phosphate-mannose-protein mannosyltransferase [Isosphaeraceae bacterium EP7]
MDRVDSRWKPGLLTLIVAAALLLRLGLLAMQSGRPMEDPDNYLPLARSLAEGRGLSLNGRATAYRPPLYPLVLAPLVAGLGDRLSWGVAALHLALGAGTVLLTNRAALGMGLSPSRALVAASLVAFDPVLAVQCRSVMTETLAALLVACSLAATTRPGLRGGFLGGVAFGLSALCRPSLLPGAALVTCASAALGPGDLRARLARSTAMALATMLTIAPWAARNLAAVGEPVFTTTHGGYTLALANNPAYYAEVVDGPPGSVWSGPGQADWFGQITAATYHMTEPQADRWLRASALATIRADPRAFARSAVAREGRFWGLAPSGAVYPWHLRIATGLWTLPFWLAAATGLRRPGLRSWPSAAAPLVAVALACVHAAYWTDLRMRAPIVPALALVAAGARLPRRAEKNSEFRRISGCKNS